MVEFGEPPVSSRSQKSQRWVDVAEQLRARPNEWAKVGELSPGVATHIRKGNYKHFLVGIEDMTPGEWMAKHWEVRTRKTEDRKKDEIWMRWIP